MYYSKIDDIDTINCKGVGVSLFVSGCTLRCEGCFNKQAWDFKAGEEFDDKTFSKLIALVQRSYIDCFSVLGGEPFEPRNRETVLEIIKEMRNLKKSKLDIYIWSGHTYEELIKEDINKEILSYCDYLIDGRFMKDKQDFNLILRGSTNQRVIDLVETERTNKVVTLYDIEKGA